MGFAMSDEDEIEDGASETSPTDGADAHPRFSERRAQVEDSTRRRRNRKLSILAGLVVLALLLAAATQSALLDIDEVRVVGAQGLTPEEVRAVAAVELGTPVLGLDTDAVERRVRSLPKVQQVLVNSSWGGVLTVEVIERLPVARIATPDGVMVLAADGMVIDVLSLSSETETETETDDSPELVLPDAVMELPEISGAMFLRDVGEFVPNVLDDALVIAAELPDDIQRVTQGVEITVDSLVLRAVGGGRISLGDARDLDEKFTTIRAFLAQVDLSCLDTLNVRAPAVPVVQRNPNCS